MIILNFFIFHAFSLPIKRYECGANINGYFYNLTNLANGRPNGFDIIKEANDDRYYFKMCGSLNHDDLPPLAPDSTDISVMRCNYSSHECATAIPLQSFDWKLLNPNNPDDGIIYFAPGEPFIDPEDKKYYTIDFEIQFKCDPSSTETNIKYDYVIINNTNEVIVRIIFKTSYGCPAKTVAPSPTPYFEPDCEFTYYYAPYTYYGIYSDFKQYNGGLYGIRTNLELEQNVKRTLFYQPCARMECPLGYTCSDLGYSSAWLCNQDGRVCESYGLINDDGIDAEIDDFKNNSYIVLTHHSKTNDEKSISLHIGCSAQYQYNHFDFEKNASLSNNKLALKAYTHGACPSYYPKPIPPFSEDTCYLPDSYFGPVNFSNFNINQGYYFQTVTDINSKKMYTLYYQPCGGIDCPSESQCDGDTNATVWLCEKVETKEKDSYNDCIAYGLIENNLTFMALNKDIEIQYSGDRKRIAIASYKCDSKGKTNKNSLSISQTISLFEKQLIFNVYSKMFCPKTSKISGGAIFLIILAVSIVLYIIIGMIVMYIKNGKISFPNVEFWKEFFVCIKTGFLYIVKCGKTPLKNEYDYDAI